MSELCAWDLDGTIRPGSLLGDAVLHGAGQGFINLDDFQDPLRPTYAEADIFVGSLRQQSRHQFQALMDRLTDEAIEQSYPWAVEELASQHGDRHAVIFSHSPDFLVRAFARGLPNLRHGKGSYFHTKDLIFSGRATTLRKAEALRRYSRKHGLTVTFAAGDTASDLPLLSQSVDRAVVVNPTEAMADLAQQHGWEIQITE